MTIGERIKNRRIELGLTQTELAERMGYTSRTSICTVEKDKEDLTTTRIRKFAKALETTPSYLMGWEDKKIDLNITVSDDERILLENFRASDEETKRMVARMLEYATMFRGK